TPIHTVPDEPHVQLSVLGGGGGGTVIALKNTIAPSAVNAFGSNGTQAQPVQVWGSNGLLLRADFLSPVSTVSLNAYNGNTVGSSYGRLDAYNAAGQIIGRYSIGALSGGGSTKMNVSRPQGDIAYVI